jgi:hypothetical protein
MVLSGIIRVKKEEIYQLGGEFFFGHEITIENEKSLPENGDLFTSYFERNLTSPFVESIDYNVYDKNSKDFWGFFFVLFCLFEW